MKKCALPDDIQQTICRMAIGPDARSAFSFVAMRVCKAWARTVCSILYRDCHIRNYVKFVGLVETVAKGSRLLPYGSFVQSIDLTAINRYGIDMRAERLIRHCHNLQSITLGHPTSVKKATIQMLVQQCRKLHTLHMGGLESWPFMLDCDFSGLRTVRRLSIETTPLQSSALQTLPSTLETLCISRMDALSPSDLRALLARQPRLRSLTIRRCRPIMNDLVGALGDALLRLDALELIGHEVTDAGVVSLCSVAAELHTLRLGGTNITHVAVQALLHDGPLKVRHIDISDNAHISSPSIKDMLSQRRISLPRDPASSSAPPSSSVPSLASSPMSVCV